MKILNLFTVFAISLLFSCTSKTENLRIQNNFTTSLDQMNDSRKNVGHEIDFLMYADENNLETLLKENKASFVLFGMVNHDYSLFEKKYGIIVKTENCVISPGISKLATINNRIISKYLNNKFDKNWKEDLAITPFGLH